MRLSRAMRLHTCWLGRMTNKRKEKKVVRGGREGEQEPSEVRKKER
jgi:hypothetical protein